MDEQLLWGPPRWAEGFGIKQTSFDAQVVGGRMIGGLQMRITTEGNIDLLFLSDEKASGKLAGFFFIYI